MVVDYLRVRATRERRSSLLWFMRSLISEPIARLANGEDQRSGRFWDGRVKPRALFE